MMLVLCLLDVNVIKEPYISVGGVLSVVFSVSESDRSNKDLQPRTSANYDGIGQFVAKLRASYRMYAKLKYALFAPYHETSTLA